MTITSATPDATVYYTTDGTQPNKGSKVAAGTITISASGNTQIRAFATATNFLDSDVSFVDINITLIPGETAPPVFNPTSTSQNNVFPVALSSETTDATICVTTDGSTLPTCNNGTCSGSSATYNAVNQVQITRTGTKVQAIACKAGSKNSAVVSQDYILKSANPTAAPAAGTFTAEQVISLDSATSGSRIVFTASLTTTPPADPICAAANPTTVDGETVTTVNGGQSLSFKIKKNVTIKAISCKDQFVTSDVQTFAYSRRAPTPVPVQATGSEFNTETTLTQAAGTPPGAPIGANGEIDCYTLDGTDPACNAGKTACATGSTNFTTAPTITRDNQSVKILRCAPGVLDSPIGTYSYRLKVSAVGVNYNLTPDAPGCVAPECATNDSTTTSVDTGLSTGVNVTGLAVSTTAGEVVCYRLDDVAPACTHTAITPTPALPGDTENIACAVGSTNAATDPINNKSLPIKVRAIACKSDFQDSAERSIFFGAATTSITVTTTPSAGTINNDVLLTFTPSQAIASGSGAICYTRAVEGAPTHPDPACNATKTACAGGSLTYNTGDQPAVNSTSSGPTTSVPTVVGNRFKVIACKPGTTGTVSDVGLYSTKVGAVVASNTSGAVPSGTVVTFSTPTLPGVGGTAGDPNPSSDPVNFCISSGATTAPSVGCEIGADQRQTGNCAAGTLAAGTTVGTNSTATRTVNSSQQYNVVACKAGYADSGVATFTYTTSGVAAPTFDLGTGNITVFRRTGATVNIGYPTGTRACYTVDGTDPSCKLDGTTDCTVGTSAPAGGTVAVPFAFSNTVDPAPSVTIKAVTCQAAPALQSAGAPTTAVFSLAASPLVISAFSDTLAAPTFNAGTGVIVPSVGNPARAVGAQPSTSADPAIDIYISQAATTTLPPTLGGTICYTLDGSAPNVRFGTPATAGVDTNGATPLNDSATAVTAAGCVAANAATTCIRGAAGVPTTVNSSVDPRLQGITHSVQVRALQCKNTGYGNSATAGNASPVNDYTFTAHSAAATFNFDGASNSGAAAFQPADQVGAGGTAPSFTWNATNIYIGFQGLTADNTPTSFIQFYWRGGSATPTNTTTQADNQDDGSLVGWPGTGGATDNQTLPLPVNYHMYFDRANVGLGPAINITPVVRFFNGTAWTTLNATDSGNAVQVKSIETGTVEVQISRAAIQNPQRFVAFGSTTTGLSFPAGATTAPAGSTGNPAVPTSAGWLRFNLSGFKPASWRDPSAVPGPGITLDSNVKQGGDTFPKANAGTDGTSGDTTLGTTQVTTP